MCRVRTPCTRVLYKEIVQNREPTYLVGVVKIASQGSHGESRVAMTSPRMVERQWFDAYVTLLHRRA